VDLGGGIKQVWRISPGEGACGPDATIGATHREYIVSGSATRAINANYRFHGYFGSESICFSNENDIFLYRAVLEKNPGHPNIGLQHSLQSKIECSDTGHEIRPTFKIGRSSYYHQGLARQGKYLAVCGDLERTKQKNSLEVTFESHLFLFG